MSPAGPPSQAGTDGFAIAALVLGILGVFGVVFGIIALRRIRRTGAHGRGLAIAGIVLSCSWIALIAVGAVLAAFGSAHRSSSGDLTVAGDVTLADLRVGDCVTSLPSGSVLTVHVAPCSDPHAGEVYDVTALSAGPYPGDDQVRRVAVGECQEALPGYVSAAPGTTGYAINYLRPVEASWSTDRKVICIAHDPSGAPLSGSIRGRGPLRP